MPEHSPGPWEYIPGIWNAAVNQRTRHTEGSIVSHEDSETPGWYVVTVENAPEAKANARLIAAAPDLLEACQKVVEHYGDPADGKLFGLRAAIAKATGKPIS